MFLSDPFWLILCDYQGLISPDPNIGYDEIGFIVLGYDDKGKISKLNMEYEEFLLALANNNTNYCERMWADDDRD